MLQPNHLFEISPYQVNHVFGEFLRRCRTSCVRQEMVPDMIFEDFGHETGSAASRGCQSHQNIGTVVPVSGQNAFECLNLPTNPLNAGNELLFFYIHGRHLARIP